jgi:hypothetical protein
MNHFFNRLIPRVFFFLLVEKDMTSEKDLLNTQKMHVIKCFLLRFSVVAEKKKKDKPHLRSSCNSIIGIFWMRFHFTIFFFHFNQSI